MEDLQADQFTKINKYLKNVLLLLFVT